MTRSNVDVEVRAEDGNAKSINETRCNERVLLSARGDAESVLVIVGEAHLAGVSERLNNALSVR